MLKSTYDVMVIDLEYKAFDLKGEPITITKRLGNIPHGFVTVEYESGVTQLKRYDFVTLS